MFELTAAISSRPNLEAAAVEEHQLQCATPNPNPTPQSQPQPTTLIPSRWAPVCARGASESIRARTWRLSWHSGAGLSRRGSLYLAYIDKVQRRAARDGKAKQADKSVRFWHKG